MKKLTAALLLVTAFASAFVGCKKEESTTPLTISLWTKESESDGVVQWLTARADDFSADNVQITIEVFNIGTVEALREDFQAAALAGTAPDLIWTVADHAGPFRAAGLIQPVDAFVDISQYVESIVMNGETWAVPVSMGNHLMLMVNKKYIPALPEDTDELIKVAKANTNDDMYGLAYNQEEAIWMTPWLGGFNGKVFDDDGITPTLDTNAMVNTLAFLRDLKFTHKLVPTEPDYDVAEALFKEGKAAMHINGDWSISGYKEVLGDDLLIGRLPKVSATGKYPAPYTGGNYFMIPSVLPTEKEEAVKSFISFITSAENQRIMMEQFSLLPGLKSALSPGAITSDPLLKGSVAQLEVGTPMPTVPEMRAVRDAINRELSAVMAGSVTPHEAVKKMQLSAVNAIARQK